MLDQADRLAAAASGANGGAIAPDMHLLTDSAAFVAFGRRSRDLYREWDDAWSGAIGLWPTRWLNLFPPGAGPLVSRQTPPAAPAPPVSPSTPSPPAPPAASPAPARFPAPTSPTPASFPAPASPALASFPAPASPTPATFPAPTSPAPSSFAEPSSPAASSSTAPPSPAAPSSPSSLRLPAELREVSADEVALLEPDVRVPEGGTAVLVEGQLGVNPQRLVAVLAGHAGSVVTGVRMLDVTVRGDRVVAVRTTAGDFTPGAVVMATGLLPRPWRTRQRWIKGHMIAVAPGPWRLGSVLGGPLGGGTPLPDGTILCGGTFDDGDLSPAVREEIADPMAQALAAVLPKAAGARISHRWCCFRPYIEGRQPVVDRLPGVRNGWFAGGHFTTGIMMAAATGEAVASWIGGSGTPDLVTSFTLAR